MAAPAIRVISVTKKKWGPHFPKSLSELTAVLLGKAKDEYLFTGKTKPKLKPKDILVFRFRGQLLGEAKFLRWSEDDDRCMEYRSLLQYRTRVTGSEFFMAGANPYPTIDAAILRKIQRAAEKTGSGPYIKTGEAESMTMHRIGQGQVRKSALQRYGNRCCLCDIDDPRLLIAGHIRGWAKAEKARGNPENVVLMCSLHDALFGKGFIALAENYRLLISRSKLSVGAYELVRNFTKKFREPLTHSPANEFLRWHKQNVFDDPTPSI